MLTLYPYSNSFPKLFKKEKEKLQAIVGQECTIKHVGSTAVPQMIGKGIIDILVIFKNRAQLKKAVKLLAEQGYFLANDNEDREGRIFMSSTGLRRSDFGDIHLHITTSDNESSTTMVLFRDYLINHPIKRQEYADLKYKLFKEVKGDRKLYTQRKNDFIKKIIQLALQK